MHIATIQMNMIAGIVLGIVCIGIFYFASKTKRKLRKELQEQSKAAEHKDEI